MYIVVYYHRLWFDVGIKRYTTIEVLIKVEKGCGLM